MEKVSQVISQQFETLACDLAAGEHKPEAPTALPEACLLGLARLGQILQGIHQRLTLEEKAKLVEKTNDTKWNGN